MSAIKFSQLKTLTNPSGETIFPVVFNGTNWKVSLDAIKGTIVTNWADVQNKPTFHETAFSGDYTRLTNLPSIPTNNNQLLNGSGFITTSSLTWNNITGKPNLFSGAYADLTGKPTLFSGSYNDLTDKPQLFNGDYNNLVNTPAIPTNTNQLTNGAGFITTSSITWEALQSSVPLATVAKTGSYTDLGNKPTIPADISDLTDTQGLLGAGTVNTGDVTFSGVKVIGAGTASGDGLGYSTLELVPDGTLVSDQYIIVDPTAPNHIHLRAGGTQDASTAELYLGGERNHVRIRDGIGASLQNDVFTTNFYSFQQGVDYDTAVWSTDEFGNTWLDINITDPMNPTRSSTPFDTPFYSFPQFPQNRIEVFDGTNYTDLIGTGYINTLGNQYQLRIGITQAPSTNPTAILSMTFRVNTLTQNSLLLENNGFDLSVNNSAYVYADQSIQLTTGVGNLQITTDDNTNSYSWIFGSNADLTLPSAGRILGYDVTVRGTNTVSIKVQNPLNPLATRDWGFSGNGHLTFPNGTTQTTAWTGSVTKSIQTVTTSTPTSITADVVFGDPNAAGGAVNLVLPASPGNGDVVTVKNINAGGNSVYVQTDGILNMETETGTIGSGVYATISTSGAFITWIYESSSTTWRIIG